jgi:Spy/CpxP family protein refolding chaperone
VRSNSILAGVAVSALALGAAVVAPAQVAQQQGTATAAPVAAAPAAGGAHMNGLYGMVGLPLDRLGLSPEQGDKIQALVDQAVPALQAQRRQLRDNEVAFRAAHPLTDFNEAAIREHVATQAKIEADLAVGIARLRASVAALLTPEQLKQVQELQAAEQERYGHGDRMRRMSHPGPAMQ